MITTPTTATSTGTVGSRSTTHVTGTENMNDRIISIAVPVVGALFVAICAVTAALTVVFLLRRYRCKKNTGIHDYEQTTALKIIENAAVSTSALTPVYEEVATSNVDESTYVNEFDGPTANIKTRPNEAYGHFNSTCSQAISTITPICDDFAMLNVDESSHSVNEADGPAASVRTAPNETYGHFNSRVTSTSTPIPAEKIDASNVNEFDSPISGIQIVPNEAYGHFSPQATNQDKASPVGVTETASITHEYDYIDSMKLTVSQLYIIK